MRVHLSYDDNWMLRRHQDLPPKKKVLLVDPESVAFELPALGAPNEKPPPPNDILALPRKTKVLVYGECCKNSADGERCVSNRRVYVRGMLGSTATRDQQTGRLFKIT